ncbi:hypothetical protein NM208_g14467 [Fusarium decemcellulare]|uniref:Uncharacterized protein n=1 Tax=Fusarium decemcellulare TaxID=57161 RepID=A0ACC1RJF0_9HYPO|nr:hypothetical protein NM208_g14467 [Fusarium decemcellulare]
MYKPARDNNAGVDSLFLSISGKSKPVPAKFRAQEPKHVEENCSNVMCGGLDTHHDMLTNFVAGGCELDENNGLIDVESNGMFFPEKISTEHEIFASLVIGPDLLRVRFPVVMDMKAALTPEQTST